MEAPLAHLEAHTLLRMRSPSSTASLLGPPDHTHTGLRSSVLLPRHSSSMAVSESEASNRASSPAATMHMRSAPLPMLRTPSQFPWSTPPCEVWCSEDIAEYAIILIYTLRPAHHAGRGRSCQAAAAASSRARPPSTNQPVRALSTTGRWPLSPLSGANRKRA